MENWSAYFRSMTFRSNVGCQPHWAKCQIWKPCVKWIRWVHQVTTERKRVLWMLLVRLRSRRNLFPGKLCPLLTVFPRPLVWSSPKSFLFKVFWCIFSASRHTQHLTCNFWHTFGGHVGVPGWNVGVVSFCHWMDSLFCGRCAEACFSLP